MRVWVTRAAPGAEATAARIRTLGHIPIVGSLLETRPIDPGCVEPPAETAALAFTSANAVRAFAAWTPGRDWPVFAVGAATAAAASELGFGSVRSADGDVSALAALIVARPETGAVLHARARETAGDLGGALAAAGVPVLALTLYETVAVDPPPHVARDWRQGDVDAVLLHSAKAARTLAAWLAGPAGAAPLRAAALGLSVACVAPLSAAGFARVQAAATSNEAALLDLLG